jgi:hypothetical protein
MADSTGGMDPAQWPLLTSNKNPSTRSPSMDSSSRGSRALGSLGSLEEGVAQLSSGDTPAYRSNANPSANQSRHISSFSSSAQHRSPLTANSHNRFPSVPQWHSSPVREPTSAKPSRSSISDLFRHRNLETLDSAEQNLASLVHHGDNAPPQSSPAQSSRKPTIPWRFLSSPIRHGDDGSRYDEGLPTSTSGSRGVSGLFENPMMPDGMPLVTSGSAGTMSDEGRMVAHDSGMMANQGMSTICSAIIA